jgi:hypothetical protein
MIRWMSRPEHNSEAKNHFLEKKTGNENHANLHCVGCATVLSCILLNSSPCHVGILKNYFLAISFHIITLCSFHRLLQKENTQFIHAFPLTSLWALKTIIQALSFIMALNMEALSHRNSVSAGISHGRCSFQNSYKRNPMHKYKIWLFQLYVTVVLRNLMLFDVKGFIWNCKMQLRGVKISYCNSVFFMYHSIGKVQEIF